MDQVQIGKFISELRKEKGLTQEQLGERLGVTQKTVSTGKTEEICRTLRCCRYCVRSWILTSQSL